MGNTQLRQWAENPCFRAQSSYIESGGKLDAKKIPHGWTTDKSGWQPTFPFAYDPNSGGAYITKSYAQYYDPSGLTYGGRACALNDTPGCKKGEGLVRKDAADGNCCPGNTSCGQVSKGITNWFENIPYACSESVEGEAGTLYLDSSEKTCADLNGQGLNKYPQCDDTTDNTKTYPFGVGNYCQTDEDCGAVGSIESTGVCVKDMYGKKSCSSPNSGYGQNAGEQIMDFLVGNTVFRAVEDAAVCYKTSVVPKIVPPGPNSQVPKTTQPKSTKENFKLTEEQTKAYMKNFKERTFSQISDQAIAKCDERDMKESHLVSRDFAGPGVNLYIIVWNDNKRNLGFKFKELKRLYHKFLKKKDNRVYIKIHQDDIKEDSGLKRIFLTILSEIWMLQFLGTTLNAKFGKIF